MILLFAHFFTVVDRILEVVNEYQLRINKLEHDIMLNPSMDSVRSRGSLEIHVTPLVGSSYVETVHVLSGDLAMHKLTLEPIKTMIYNLRR